MVGVRLQYNNNDTEVIASPDSGQLPGDVVPLGQRVQCLARDEPAEADVYSFSWRPSTTCVARSVAMDFITR